MTAALRVLLIDDNDDQRSALADQLLARGWVVETAHDARQGLDAVARMQPTFVLTELILPDTRGLGFARSLRSMVDYDMVVIALTRIPVQLHQRARDAGFDLVHSKPVDIDMLHARMSKAIAYGFTGSQNGPK